MIEENISQRNRLEKLNYIARKEFNILLNDKNIQKIKEIDKDIVLNKEELNKLK